MGKCIYCGQPAGFLRSKHKECEVAHLESLRLQDAGRQQIIQTTSEFIQGQLPYEELEAQVSPIEETHNLSRDERSSLFVKAWEEIINKSLEDGPISPEKETRLVKFQKQFGLEQEVLDRNGVLTRFTKSAVIRDLLDGKIPERLNLSGSLPINFQKDEQIVWVFSPVKYLEDKIQREYVGGSQGMSFRVMKGVYYRVGAFKGHSVDHQERVLVAIGILAITNKHIYFYSERKSFKIPYTKIVSFEPMNDGIGIMKDSANAKLQTFITEDGWFTNNLISNLAKL